MELRIEYFSQKKHGSLFLAVMNFYLHVHVPILFGKHKQHEEEKSKTACGKMMSFPWQTDKNEKSVQRISH